MGNVRARDADAIEEANVRDVYVILKHTVPMTTTTRQWWLCELSRAANRPYLFIGPIVGILGRGSFHGSRVPDVAHLVPLAG